MNDPITLAEAETRIRQQAFETVYVFDRQTGACLFKADGEESRAELPYHARLRARDNIILHNHPKNRNISEADIETLQDAHPQEFRIVTPVRRLCWFQPEDGWHPNLMTVYRKHFRTMLLRLHPERERGKLTEAEFQHRLFEKVNRRTVDELNVLYTEEPWKSF